MTSFTKRQKMSNARLAVVQALYLYSLGNNSADDIVLDFVSGRLGGELIDEDPKTGKETFVNIAEVDKELFRSLFDYAVKNQKDINTVISSSLAEDWSLDRLESVLLAILQAGVAEIYSRTQTDVPVIISEYIEICRSFYSEGAEVSTVNAILDKVAKIVRE